MSGVILLSNIEQKAIVAFAIEDVLLKISSKTLETVESNLLREYGYTIPECYEHPEYLAKILKDTLGQSYIDTVGKVITHLDEFAYQRPIADFLEKMSGNPPTWPQA